MKQFSLLPAVSEVRGQAMASSLDVAAYFGKRHDNVLRDIVNLLKIEEIKTFANNNFTPSEYLDARGRTYPVYLMTKDGFTLLAMGFTGPKALEFKLAYIAAFNAMARELVERRAADALAAERLEALIRVNGPRAALADQAILLHEEGLNKAQVAALMGLSSRYVVYRLFRRYAAALRGKRREILV